MKKTLKITIIIIFFLLTSGFDYAFGQFDEAELVNREVKQINDDISDKKSQIKKIQDKQAEYEAVIKEKQQEKASLNNQLALLDNRLAKSELDIDLVSIDIDRVKLEIQKTAIEIENRNKDIETNKSQIEDVLKLIQKRDNVNTLEVLLLNETLSEFLTQVKYLEDINENIGVNLKNIENLKLTLERDQKDLGRKNEELLAMKKDLEEKKEKLAAEKENKAVILTQVGKTEKEFQRLLAKAKKEQEDAAAEIASMEKLMRAKLASLENNKLDVNVDGMVWPVNKNVVTSYFHDPGYPFRNIFEHPAIDIRAKQGSVVRAAASGYVARVKSDGSSNYGYIMLIHGDNLSTVYGHVSKATVSEDDYVVQGQAIGLSGGMPGTPGAGRMTTGPHLHFEVRLNGIPVDPLSFLP